MASACDQTSKSKSGSLSKSNAMGIGETHHVTEDGGLTTWQRRRPSFGENGSIPIPIATPTPNRSHGPGHANKCSHQSGCARRCC